IHSTSLSSSFFFFKQKTAYEIGLGIPAEPLFRSILVIILLLHFLSLMLGSVLVLMLPLLVWLTPDLRIKKSLLKCNWTIRKRLPRCKMRLKRDCWHSVGDFTPEYERPGICTK